MRPIGAGSPEGIDPNDIIINSCESAPLAMPMQPINNVKFQDSFWLKDNLYSLNDMFGGFKYDKEWIAKHF